MCDRSKFGTLNLSNKIRFIKVKTVSTKVDITKLKLDARPILHLFRKTAILKISIYKKGSIAQHFQEVDIYITLKFTLL